MAVEEPPVIGGTYIWSPTFSKDGTVYNITGATVTITFRNPGAAAIAPAAAIPASTTSFAMSIVSGAAGTATYTNLTTLFTARGKWNVSYKVVLSGVELESREISFDVYRSLKALAA